MAQRDDDSVDRDAILARRALFLSSALAALSCSPATPTGSGTTPTVEVSSVPTPNTSSATRPDGTVTDPDDQPPPVPHKAWEEVITQAPPRNVSTKISKIEQENLTQLNSVLDQTYAAVREVWIANPGCDPAKPDCRDGWRALGEKTRAAHGRLTGLGRSLCSGDTSNPPTYGARRGYHQVFLQRLLADAVEHMAAIAKSYSAQGEQEWRKIAANAAQPPPMPCLSCMAPQIYPVGASVRFADGSDVLDANDAQVASALAALKEGITKQPPTGQGKVRVRGHADPKERDAERVALARAKAVVTWLGRSGIAAKQLEAVGLGAEVPVDNGSTPDGAAANRRVDIEIELTPGTRP